MSEARDEFSEWVIKKKHHNYNIFYILLDWILSFLSGGGGADAAASENNLYS